MASALAAAWVLYTGMLLGRFRATRGRQRLLEIVCAAWVTVALGGVLAADRGEATGLAALWAETALVSGALAALLLTSWLALRAARFAISPAVDILACFGATASLVGVLVDLAVRLYPLAPFGALVVGVLSFFLPVNAVAEVFHAGVKADHTPRHAGSKREQRI